MKRKHDEINNDEQPKKYPQQSTLPRLDTIEGILEDLKTTIAKHGPFNALKPYIESNVLCYFDSDLSDKPEDLGKLLYGIQMSY